MFGADTGVIQAGGAGGNVGGLAVVVLEDVAERAVEDAGLADGEAGGVVAEGRGSAAGFNADEFYRRVVDERMEDAGSIRAAANAGDDIVGELGFDFEALGAG